MREPGMKYGIGHHARWRGRRDACHKEFAACGQVPDAPEPSTCRCDVRLQYRHHVVAQHQVGMADDAFAHIDCASAPLRLVGDPGDKLGFAHWAQGFWSIDAIAVSALEIDRGHNLMPRIQVDQKFVQEIPAVPVP